jgi:hypothetical protein
MPNHTPGPWSTDESGEVDTSAADLSSWDGVLANGEVVAYCHPDNAALIAAAPEMLAILKYLWEWNGVVGKFDNPVWDKVRPLIDKAEGRK